MNPPNCGIFQNVENSICNTLFLAKPVGGELIQTAESLESGFFPVEEALEKVTWKDFRKRIEYCLKTETQPFCVEFHDQKNI